MTTTVVAAEIRPSAHKHGISDDDIAEAEAIVAAFDDHADDDYEVG